MKRRRGDDVETGGRERWLGGFVRRTANGKPIYVIERRIRGALFKVSTRRHTEDAAVRELRRFEADPYAYDPLGGEVLKMTPELVLEYCDWMEAPVPHGKGNTRDWVLQCASFLRDWLAALGHLDLRRIDALKHIKPALKTWRTSQPSRIVALKGFFSWLRKEKGLLKHHEDPTPDVRIPRRGAAKETETGARDVAFDRVQLVFNHLRADVKPLLQLAAGTGWHLAEIIRFAYSGRIQPDPTGKSLGVLVYSHKNRERASTGITNPEHLETARQIREKGYTLSRATLNRLITRARREAGLDDADGKVTFGSMRHNVGNWAIEDGETVETTAKAFNHTSEKMLRRHYLRHHVPRAVIKTRVLK